MKLGIAFNSQPLHSAALRNRIITPSDISKRICFPAERFTMAATRRARKPEMDALPMIRRTAGVSEYSCEDAEYAHFRPNLSPKEIFQGGAFGGTYFRDIEIEGVHYKDAWKEFASPATDWFDGLDIKNQIASPRYSVSQNKYKVKCGQSLDEWLSKGWIDVKYDSHGVV